MGASLTKPSKVNEFGVQYVQKNTASPDQTDKPEWGDGEVIYLSIAVTDTGRGLSEKEKKNLFHLFKVSGPCHVLPLLCTPNSNTSQQASPKTYTQYGGSGLGLFISRQLVEMQGGEVGVASEAAAAAPSNSTSKPDERPQSIDSSQIPISNYSSRRCSA